MSTSSRTESDEEVLGKARRAERLATVVAASVLHALGKPTDLFRVSVVWLWENRYRVNVQVGPDAVSARVAHSYFLEVDEAGAVLTASPAIARLY